MSSNTIIPFPLDKSGWLAASKVIKARALEAGFSEESANDFTEQFKPIFEFFMFDGEVEVVGDIPDHIRPAFDTIKTRVTAHIAKLISERLYIELENYSSSL